MTKPCPISTGEADAHVANFDQGQSEIFRDLFGRGFYMGRS
jgi:hypothetical protein